MRNYNQTVLNLTVSIAKAVYGLDTIHMASAKDTLEHITTALNNSLIFIKSNATIMEALEHEYHNPGTLYSTDDSI